MHQIKVRVSNSVGGKFIISAFNFYVKVQA